MKTRHDGDCTIYSALENRRPEDGICTCGYGLEIMREERGDAEMYSRELKEKLSLDAQFKAGGIEKSL